MIETSMEEYYFSDGISNPQGPHNLSEIRDLLQEGAIKAESLIWRPGDPQWQELKKLPEYSEIISKVETCDHDRTIISKALKEENSTSEEKPQEIVIEQTVEDKAEAKDEAEEEKVKRPSRHQLLRTVRKDLDALWECQREAIISAIKDQELDEVYQSTRKQNKQIYYRIEDAVLNYWRVSGLMRQWIGELTWQEADFTRRLRGKDEFERYEDLQNWIAEKRVSDIAGCYAFKTGKRYIYVGRAEVLSNRLKNYEKSKYLVLPEVSVRIIIPKYKTQRAKLERLLILQHQPEENRNAGDIGKNPVDDCLAFIRSEVQELLTDF